MKEKNGIKRWTYLELINKGLATPDNHSNVTMRIGEVEGLIYDAITDYKKGILLFDEIEKRYLKLHT